MVIIKKIKPIIKKAIESNNHDFYIGDYVQFILETNNGEMKCCGIIKDIKKEIFKISHVKIDGKRLHNYTLNVKYESVKNGYLFE